MGLLESLGLADDALTPVQHLPYGRQRLVEVAVTLGQRPRVLLLDEPAAGVPSTESHLILDVLAALPEEIAILIIEHDMDVVFSFARSVTVLVDGAILTEGTPEEIARDPEVRTVYLGARRAAGSRPSMPMPTPDPGAATSTPPANATANRSGATETTEASGSGHGSGSMLALEGVFAGYGETVVIESVDFALAPGESLSVIGRNGVGKSSLLATIMGHTTLRGGRDPARGRGHRAPGRRRGGTEPGSATFPRSGRSSPRSR